MLHFPIQDQQPSNASCVQCCCEKVALKPGTTTKLSVGYATWAVPIGWLHCAPQFQLEQMDTCAQIATDLPPSLAAGIDMVKFDTGTNVVLNGDLKTKITDPEGKPLTFKGLGLYGPKNGTVALANDGLFKYTPRTNYRGEDRFYVSASDIVSTVTFEVMVAIGIDSGTVYPTPHVSIVKEGVVVDQRFYNVSFPVTVSPAAQECEVWRLTVLQGAMDCDCNCYTRTDCFDIGVAKC